ncbi:MAG: pyridoxal-dependent aspartate 1-decarboxylase PanP [Pseudomonadota bacterium]
MTERRAEANLESLHRIFSTPEAPDSTLSRIEREISSNLSGFLAEHIVATNRALADIEADFASTVVPEEPRFVSDHTDFLLRHVVAESVHTASPRFIGHMTSALPYFMVPLTKMMAALNQNVVKTETAKAMTPLERQVLGMLHHLVYAGDEAFYAEHVQNPRTALGAFCSGGTIANVTSLWVARNRALPAGEGFAGVDEEGLHRGLAHHGFDDVAILVSELGHYSLVKAANVLGLGRRAVRTVPIDSSHRVRPERVLEQGRALAAEGTKVLAVVGIAGTTETGHVDPLADLADVCAELQCHFHVDAAWGGPTLFSSTHRDLLAGIERADSVTLDAHKQLYVPLGAGMAVFKDPSALASIEHHARYIIREGSKDIGSRTLEGSRPAMAMLVHAALHIIARQGFELLIDLGIDRARRFAEMIEAADDFELITHPELNILTYRYVPRELWDALASKDAQRRRVANEQLDTLTEEIQRYQREAGTSFVSRTRVSVPRYDFAGVGVFRVVLANPLTDEAALAAVLEEQRQLGQRLVPAPSAVG